METKTNTSFEQAVTNPAFSERCSRCNAKTQFCMCRRDSFGEGKRFSDENAKGSSGQVEASFSVAGGDALYEEYAPRQGGSALYEVTSFPSNRGGAYENLAARRGGPGGGYASYETQGDLRTTDNHELQWRGGGNDGNRMGFDEQHTADNL